MPYQQIWLTGFIATGKSAAAPAIAEQLGWDAIDIDALIEGEAGEPVREIFARGGEAAFRALESGIIDRVAHMHDVVVATGGGSVLREANRAAMRRHGFVVTLDAAPETIARRIIESGADVSERPLLAGGDPLERIRELKDARQALYDDADLCVDTDARDVAAVRDAVLAAFRERSARECRTIPVKARAGDYDVHCQWGALDELGALMREAGLSGDAYVLTDDAVGPLLAERALASLRGAGFEADVYEVPAGEASKQLPTVGRVYDWLLEHHAERSSAIVALGGGVVGDLAGFVAATYLRGVPFVQAPTSLLAMVDASIGGKVGVDHARGKNLIGAFYSPRLVVQDTSVLASLPERALREGFAEVIKHGLVLDPPMLDVLERDAERLLAVEPRLITDIVARNAAFKARIVSEDEREGGSRMLLNYGHTVGHAIEAVTGYGDIRHGEAISAGMMAAAAIGQRIGVTAEHIAHRQRALFARYGLPKRHPGVDADAVLAAIALDKKVAAKRVRWILLEDFGRPLIRDDVDPGLVREVLHELFA
jgi:3-dehydroquinate synthase